MLNIHLGVTAECEYLMFLLSDSILTITQNQNKAIVRETFRKQPLSRFRIEDFLSFEMDPFTIQKCILYTILVVLVKVF